LVADLKQKSAFLEHPSDYARRPFAEESANGQRFLWKKAGLVHDLVEEI
jgi:hypothetical protein